MLALSSGAGGIKALVQSVFGTGYSLGNVDDAVEQVLYLTNSMYNRLDPELVMSNLRPVDFIRSTLILIKSESNPMFLL